MPIANPDSLTEAFTRIGGAFRRDEVTDLLAGVAAMILLVLVLAGWAGGVRTLFAFAFAFFVPGRAIVSNWPRLALWSDVGMSVVLSIAALALLALVSLWLRFWHPVDLFEAEAVLSLIGLGVAVARRRRLAGAAPAEPQG